jgi:hypothetical protein
MEREQVIKKVDILIRELLHSGSKTTTDENNNASEETNKLKYEIEEEDKVKLANLFEDLIVLLKDDPDNKNEIKKLWNRIMDGYGHVKPVSEILGSIKSLDNS